jgi:hypothetical protein
MPAGGTPRLPSETVAYCAARMSSAACTTHSEGSEAACSSSDGVQGASTRRYCLQVETGACRRWCPAALGAASVRLLLGVRDGSSPIGMDGTSVRPSILQSSTSALEYVLSSTYTCTSSVLGGFPTTTLLLHFCALLTLALLSIAMPRISGKNHTASQLVATSGTSSIDCTYQVLVHVCTLCNIAIWKIVCHTRIYHGTRVRENPCKTQIYM